ncbi:MAG: hypothetical protein ACI9Y1_001536 [Lentisphaeria bacterium]|jgi:hypothetical protein
MNKSHSENVVNESGPINKNIINEAHLTRSNAFFSAHKSNVNKANADHYLVTNEAYTKQLLREITCLERQLDRLRNLNGHLDNRTQSTYEEMISSRMQLLKELH